MASGANALELSVPPLRDRLEDLPLILERFSVRATYEDAVPRFDEEAVHLMANCPWPGNVRELLNVVNHLALTASERVSADDVRRVLQRAFPDGLFAPPLLRSRPLPQLQAQLEREYLQQLHADCGGEVKVMAARLGISLQALYKKFGKLGLKPKEMT